MHEPGSFRTTRPGLDKLFTGNDSRAKMVCGIFDAHVKYRYTLKEVGEHLGIHYTTVSKAVSRIEEALTK
jgi:hypothetical protein